MGREKKAVILQVSARYIIYKWCHVENRSERKRKSSETFFFLVQAELTFLQAPQAGYIQ